MHSPAVLACCCSQVSLSSACLHASAAVPVPVPCPSAWQLRELVPPQAGEPAEALQDGPGGDSRRPKHTVLSDTIRLIKDMQLQLAGGTQAPPPAAAAADDSGGSFRWAGCGGGGGWAESVPACCWHYCALPAAAPLPTPRAPLHCREWGQHHAAPPGFQEHQQQQAQQQQAQQQQAQPPQQQPGGSGPRHSGDSRHPELPLAPDDAAVTGSGVVVESVEGSIKYVKVSLTLC